MCRSESKMVKCLQYEILYFSYHYDIGLYAYLIVMQHTGLAVLNAQLIGGPSAVCIYVHCAISAKFGVVVCKASMLD